jgi:MFS family permease
VGRALPFYSRYTYRLHLRALMLDGATIGIFSIADVILRKSLAASSLEITLYTMLSPLSLLTAVVFSSLILGRRRAPFFLWAGLLGRLPLLLGVFVRTPLELLGLMCLHAFASAAVLPAFNTIYQANYRSDLRGRVFGRAAAVAVATEIVVSLLCGAALEWDPRAYRVLIPLAGLLGFLSMRSYARIKVRGERRRFRISGRESVPLGEALRKLARTPAETLAFLRSEPAFRRFEGAFLVYGIGFFIMLPVIPIYLVDHLHATYIEAAAAKGVAFGGARIAFFSFFGQLVDRMGPIRAGIRIFALLALFPLALAAAHSMPPAYAAFALYGTGMAGVSIIWSLGSIHFAKDRDSAAYQGVHVTLVGVRGALGPLIGYVAMTAFGPRAAMLVATVALLSASALLVRLSRDPTVAK